MIVKPSMVNEIWQICNAWGESCSWLNNISPSNPDLTCLINIDRALTGIAEAVETSGLDIFADWDALEGLWNAMNDC